MGAITFKDIREGQEISVVRNGAEYRGTVVSKNDNNETLNFVNEQGTLQTWYGKYGSNDVYKILKDKIEEKELNLLKIQSSVRNLRWGGSSLGSDPEFFIEDSKTGEIIPAFDFLPDQKSGAGVPFWDGFQAEFNISGGGCLDQRVSSMKDNIMMLNRMAKDHNKRASLILDSVVEIPESQFNSVSPKFLEFGCSPSKNAYNEKLPKLNGTETRYRTVGGHIHFGLNNSDPKRIVEYVKALDKILGVACVALFQNFDNPVRRQYYGRAGEYRIPSHGLEYRTLTNAWASDPRMMYIVFELSRKCIAMVEQNLIQHWDASEEETIECINNCDVNMAQNILMLNKTLFKDIIMSFSYGRQDTTNIIFNTFMQGMEVMIKDPLDIIKNWNVDIFRRRILEIEEDKTLVSLKKNFDY